MDLIDLREEYEASGDFAHLKEGKHVRYIAGRGATRPVAMLLGEAPNATETLAGKPFLGTPGAVLAQLMGLAGLRAEDRMVVPPDVEAGEPEVGEYANAYLTLTVKYRPPGNRVPTEDEIARSLPWVRKEWQVLHRPPVIITLGGVAARCLLTDKFQTPDFVGNPFPIAAGGPTIWPMYHPKTALRKPEIRPACEEHWQALGAWLEREGLA